MKAFTRLFLAVLVASTGACATLPLERRPLAPPALVARLQGLARAFPGRMGIAVQDIQAGWIADDDGEKLYPQQSVSKLWVAMTVFDAIDHGEATLADPVRVGREDMSVFNQPIQKRLVDGVYATNLDDLLVYAIAQSDNAANDILVRKVGGSGVVRRWLSAHRVAGVRCGPEERILQSEIAGVSWRPEYSFGQAFWAARDRVAPKVRAARLQAYLADPPDGATPDGVVQGLSRLAQGRLHPAASSDPAPDHDGAGAAKGGPGRRLGDRPQDRDGAGPRRSLDGL